MTPDVRYAKSGDVHVAYQIAGDGPFDLVFVPGFVSHLETNWEALAAPFFERLASFCRLILFDKRGTGMSDRVEAMPTLEERMDDVRAVMDAAGSEEAVLFGISEGGPMVLLFAATYPARTRALALYGSTPRFLRAPDFPWAPPAHTLDALIGSLESAWGTGAGAELFAPSYATDEAFRAGWGRVQRLAASPGAMIRIMEMLKDIDVRHILPAISAPTLIVHRTGDLAIPVKAARYLAEWIPGARFVELPGDDHVPFHDADQILDVVEEFLTGAPPRPEADRVLATVLFTDIVASTERLAELGDRRWADLLRVHDRAVRAELDRFRGREVKTTGDGFLATFDGPARAIRCACAIREAARRVGVDVRAGLHTGELEVRNGDVGGIAVHIGARVAALAGPGEVLVSRTVTDLVAGSGLTFAERGDHELKGVPGHWGLYAVES